MLKVPMNWRWARHKYVFWKYLKNYWSLVHLKHKFYYKRVLCIFSVAPIVSKIIIEFECWKLLQKIAVCYYHYECHLKVTEKKIIRVTTESKTSLEEFVDALEMSVLYKANDNGNIVNTIVYLVSRFIDLRL